MHKFLLDYREQLKKVQSISSSVSETSCIKFKLVQTEPQHERANLRVCVRSRDSDRNQVSSCSHEDSDLIAQLRRRI